MNTNHLHVGGIVSNENLTEVPSSPHEYEYVSDTDIQMNQLRRDPITAIGNMEELEISEDYKEGDGQEDELNIDPTPINVVVNDSRSEAHSHSLARGDYSSLKVRETAQQQPVVYSRIDVQAAVNERDQQKDTVPSKPHYYYNLP